MSEIVNFFGFVPDPDLFGLKALRWIRVSSDGQADTSQDGQRLTTDKFSSVNGIQIVDEIEFIGSGSEAKNIEEMLQMVLKKIRDGIKFDLVLVNDLSRLGRAGGDVHGYVVFTLAKHGVRVVSATQHMPDSRYSVLFRQLTSFSDQQYAERIANNTANGAMRSILEGRSLPTRIPLYGTYFEYSTSDHNLIGLYRRLRDGTRQLLHPQSREVQQVYRAESPGFRKRKQDLITLVPGDPQEQKVVVDIYEMYFLCGMSPSEIANHLNSDYQLDFDVAWDHQSIQNLVLNESYTGFCYANRFTNHLYVQRDPASPLPSITLGLKRYGIRPMSNWVRVELPRMIDFFPPELKAIAEVKQAEFWSQFEDGHQPTPRTTNGRRDYPLSSLITEKITGELMKGCPGGPKGRERRYYKLSPAKIKKAMAGPDAPADRAAISSGIPADCVEKEFYCRLECLLRSIGDFRGMLVEEIKSQDRERCKGTQDLNQLLREQEELKEKYDLLVERLSRGNKDRINKLLDETDAKLDALEQKIESVGQFPPLDDEQVEKVADSILRNLRKIIGELSSSSDAVLFALIDEIVSSAVADLQQRTVQFEFAVPASMINQAIVGLDGLASCKKLVQTYKWNPIYLAETAIHWPERCTGDCWDRYSFGCCEECFECDDCDSCEECDENYEDCLDDVQDSDNPEASGSGEHDAAA